MSFYKDYRQLSDLNSATKIEPGNNLGTLAGLSAPSTAVQRAVGELGAYALAPFWGTVRRVIGEKEYEPVIDFQKPRTFKMYPSARISTNGIKLSMKPYNPPPGARRRRNVTNRSPKSQTQGRTYRPPFFRPPNPRGQLRFTRGPARGISRRNYSTIPFRPRAAYGGRPAVTSTAVGNFRGRPGAVISKPVPVAYFRTARLGFKMKPRVLPNGDTEIKFDMWDSVVSAFYPTANDPRNFVVFGNSLATAVNDYPLAPWNSFYNISPLYDRCQGFSEFRFKRFGLEYQPILNPTEVNGEIIFLSVKDFNLLYNKGLTFTCPAGTSATRPELTDGDNYVVTDYSALYSSTPWGAGVDNTSTIKQWEEAMPKQFVPYTKFMYMSKNHWLGWKRNNVPGGAIKDKVYDFSLIDETESRLCTSGGMCMWGQLSDGTTYSSASKFRKIGDVYVHATVALKGLGNASLYADTPFLTSSQRLLRRCVEDKKFMGELAQAMSALDDMCLDRKLNEQRRLQHPDDFVSVEPPTRENLSLLPTGSISRGPPSVHSNGSRREIGRAP